MTSKKNGGKGASPPEGAGDGMNLLIGWRAGARPRRWRRSPPASGVFLPFWRH